MAEQTCKAAQRSKCNTQLIRRSAPQGVTANSVNLGGIMTALQKHLPAEEQRAMGWMDEDGNFNPLFKNTGQGAATSVCWAELSARQTKANAPGSAGGVV